MKESTIKIRLNDGEILMNIFFVEWSALIKNTILKKSNILIYSVKNS